MTKRQDLIELTAGRLNRYGGHVDPRRIEVIADEIVRECGANSRMWDWWTSTEMSTRSWKLFCSSVVKQINARRRYQTDAEPIQLNWTRH